MGLLFRVMFAIRIARGAWALYQAYRRGSLGRRVPDRGRY